MASMEIAGTVSRGAKFRRAALPYLYLVPAFAVMTVITFYPSFTR